MGAKAEAEAWAAARRRVGVKTCQLKKGQLALNGIAASTTVSALIPRILGGSWRAFDGPTPTTDPRPQTANADTVADAFQFDWPDKTYHCCLRGQVGQLLEERTGAAHRGRRKPGDNHVIDRTATNWRTHNWFKVGSPREVYHSRQLRILQTNPVF